MREVGFRKWKFEVDDELTRKAFDNISSGDADNCECDYCRNFCRQRYNIYPQEIKDLFNILGIDFRKEESIWQIDQLDTGLINYDGYFHFAGKIIFGETFDSEEYSGIELLQISENFSITFGEKRNGSWVKVLFEVNIPWILEKNYQG